MNDFWFEIIRRSGGRYAWVFVAVRDGRPRVLARSGRDYRSRRKVRRAIERLRYAFPNAEIRRGSFDLPRTRFELVPGVLPLIVREAPSGSAGYVPASRGRAVAAIQPRRTRSEDAEQQEAVTAEAPQEQERPEEEQQTVPSRRGRKAT